MRRGLALLLAFLALPTVAADVAGPDEDGSYRVAFLWESAQAGAASLALQVDRDDGERTTRRTDALGLVELPAGPTRWNATFLPEGAGAYLLTLLVDGAPADEERLVVRDAAGGASRVTFEVPDEPTRLTLDRDDVNADGKTKAPGDPVITRVRISDANGMSDLDGLVARVERDGAPVEDAAFPVPGPGNSTNVSFEHRFDRSPAAAGEHRLVLHAIRGGVSVASVARTFVIKDVAPTLEPATLEPVAADADLVRAVGVVLADRNGPGPGLLEARVYRGSARAEAQGVLARFGASPTVVLAEGAPLAPMDGSARTQYPLDVTIPRGAAVGSYRVSLYANGSLVGAIPFEVRPTPTLVAFHAAPEGPALRVRANASGPGVLTLRILQGDVAVATRDLPVEGPLDARLDAPTFGATYRWIAELRSRPGGPVLAQRQGEWTTSLDAPALEVRPGPVRRAWELSSAWDLAGGAPSLEVRRWDGAAVPGFEARLVHGRLLVDAPAGLESGRYDARLRIALPNGSVAQGAWSFEEGPILRVALGAPVVEGREARIAVRNDGGVPVARLVATSTAPGATLALEHGGRTVAARGGGERAAFDLALAPGDEATLVLRLPPGPLKGGALAADVRVLAQGAR